MYPCKNLSAIATRWSRSRSRGGYSDRGAVIAIAERRDISDRNAIKINRARDSDAMIAIAAKLWRSQRDDRDRGAISGTGLRSWRWNRDRCGNVLIAAWWSRSRRSYSDHQRDDRDRDAILKNRIRDLRPGLRSCRWNRDRSGIVHIAGSRSEI